MPYDFKKSGIGMSNKHLGLKLGVERSRVEMSCNQSTAWISFGIGTFANIALFFAQFPYSTYTDDIFTNTDEKSSQKPIRPTRGFQGLDGFPKIKKSTKLKDILHWIWAHVLGFIFSGLCLVSSVNTFR